MKLPEINTRPAAEIEARLPEEHPSSYYAYAARLLAEGRRDDAVRWFYIGQLRYRIYLQAKPPADPSGDPALFAALNATVGQVVNEYAGGNPVQWAREIRAALQWDEEHPNASAPRAEFSALHREVRAGLAELGQQIAASADEIRATRQSRGLENRA